MTDAELSKELALALGYAPESVRVGQMKYRKGVACKVYRWSRVNQCNYWRVFDYRDPTVCFPLIKWLMQEHNCDVGAGVNFIIWFNSDRETLHADTLEEAAARAVIAVKGKP